MNSSEFLSSREMSPEEKMEILRDAMFRNQPDFDDFRGKPGFSRGMLERDRGKLAAKRTRMHEAREDEASGDRYAGDAEPLITYILNEESFLKTRDSFAFLTSEFDDKMNGADIVFGVEKKDHSGEMVFAIDVATGTDPAAIEHKIKNIQRHDWMSKVDYCMHDGEYWSEPEAPCFVLGMMPASIDKATDKVRISSETIAREVDPMTDFMLASEMYEQINMQIRDIDYRYSDEMSERQISKLKDLRTAVKAKLYKICQVKGETKEERAKDFELKYPKAMKQVGGDLVYRNIINEVRKQKNRVSGQMAMKGA